ncbi:MAG: zinc D-Ala-D-Ala dipeptidase, partial [Gemmatimonadales bacterium]|nr:zinc D-Ala-D-Ala dipeptidase [Gemmatimonadales bacterium]
ISVDLRSACTRDQLGHKTPPGEQQLSTTPCVRCGAQHDPGASPCPEPSLVGRTLGAGIRVRERLRDTPLGTLYRAEYPTGLEVAVVLLGSTSADSGALALRRQRCRDAIQIQHPNVAAIHELSETDDGLVYVVAEFLTGELLSETLAKRGALPLGDALDLCLQAAGGLQAAHELGWVHGRLSPDSILLTGTVGDHPLVKLIAFSPESLLRRADAQPPIEQGVSLQYASPERIAGHPSDERADVYSLGAVLHHLLTGVPPTLGGAAPEGMRAVLRRALDPSPARRFQTVAEFVAALARPVEPVVNQLPEPTRTGGRKLLRNLWPEQRVVAAVLVAVFAGLWLLWATYKPGLDAPGRPRLEESGSAAQREPDSISSSSASSAPGRLRAKSAPASPVPRESLSSRIPAASGPPPPASSNAAADSLLVDVRSIDPTIQTDLRYATANNFTGAPLPGYEAPRALLRREAAAALGRVQAGLRSKGLGLRVLDAYRPVRASVAMVDWAKRTGNQSLIEKGYIPERSRHNLGASVDVTLVDLATGTEVLGTTAFDNFTGTADTANATAQALGYRKILVQTMESEGFSPFGRAWWHFNYPAEGAVPLDRIIR